MTPIIKELLGDSKSRKNIEVRTLVKWLEKQGWNEIHSRNGHRHFKHNIIVGRITICGNPKDTVSPGVLIKAIRQSGNNV